MKSLRCLACCCLAVLCSLALARGAAADVLYSTSFDGPNGTQPADWSVLYGGAGDPGWRLNNGDYFYNVFDNGLTRYTGALVDPITSAPVNNYTIVADFRKGTTGGYAGLAGRIGDSGNFYHARLIENNSQLQLYRFVNGAAVQLGTSVNVSGYDISDTWRIAMTFSGPTISARLFDENGALRGTITQSDATHAAGGVGLRANATTAYENFTVKTPTLLAYDGFYGTPGAAGYQSYASGVTLREQNAPRHGFVGPWTPTPVSQFAAGNVDFDVQATGLEGFGVQTTPGALEIYRRSGAPNTTTKTVERALSYQLAPEDEVWGSFLFSLDGFGADSRMDVKLEGVGNRDLTFGFLTDGSGPGASLTVTGGGDDGTVHNLGSITAGETHLLVFRATPRMGDGDADAFHDALSIWIDPIDINNLGDPDAVGFARVRNQGDELGDIFGFEKLSLTAVMTPAGYSFFFDEFRLGTGLEALSLFPVPEPSAWALACGGLLGVVWLTRRRRAAESAAA